jgi:hypothetical protein
MIILRAMVVATIIDRFRFDFHYRYRYLSLA